jgi:hypothetical protein
MTRTPRAIKKDIHDLTALIAGFEVIVVWGGQLFRHLALNAVEAQDWAAQYKDVPASVRIWAGDQQVCL